jgi:hypothetical protein
VFDRSLFWRKVDQTKTPRALRRMSSRELQDYQIYFLESQYDHNAPPQENLVASEHLTWLQSEFDRRRHNRTQLIAGAGIVVTILGILVGQCRYRANMQVTTPPQARTSVAPAATPTAPTPEQVPTAPSTVSPTPTPTPTPTRRSRKSRRSQSTPEQSAF